MLFGKPDSDDDDSEMKCTDIPVITISSSVELTPEKSKKNFTRRLFGGIMGNRPTNNPVPRRVVMGNPEWSVGANPVAARHSSFTEQYNFNRDAYSSTTRIPDVGGPSQSPLRSMGIHNTPWYEKWQSIEGDPYFNHSYQGDCMNAGYEGDGAGSSNSHPI